MTPELGIRKGGLACELCIKVVTLEEESHPNFIQLDPETAIW